MAEIDDEFATPYMVKLADFIAQVPAVGAGEVTSRGKDGGNDAYFARLTGMTHDQLLTKWKVDRTTTCNNFVGQCAIAMGFTGAFKDDSIGRFDIADQLARYGRGHCWVPAESGSEPEYGDIFRLYSSDKDHNGVNLNHMGVSLRVVDGKWLTVEAGQGGPSKGYDAVARKEREWKPKSLQGWVSMRAVLALSDPTPYWLGGWWEIKEKSGAVYYYYFGDGGRVMYSSQKPINLTQPPAHPETIGIYAKHPKRMYDVLIRWSSVDQDEVFSLATQDMKARKFTMVGESKARNVKFGGKRLLLTGLL